MNQHDGPLRSARVARSWSQARAAAEIATLARERGVPVAGAASLKTQLSRWENQHAVPEEHYRALLCALYQSSEVELGLRVQPPAPAEAPDATARLRAELAEAAELAPDGIGLLREQLRATRDLDRRLGTAAAEGMTQAQLSYLERMLVHAVRAATRRDVAELVADCALLAGEHALDQLRPGDAWRLFDTARRTAAGHSRPGLAGCALARQAEVLLEIGEPRLGAELVEQAVELADGRAPGPLRARLTASRGRVLAATGSTHQAHQAYRQAEHQLGERAGPTMGSVRCEPVAGRIDFAFGPNPPLELQFTLDDLRRHRGHSLAAREPGTAIDDLDHALRVGGTTTRDTAAIHVDLAHAHGAVGDAAAATRHAGLARDLVRRIGSPRLGRRLDERPADLASRT